MAYKVSNINDLFRVKSDGAIEFGTSGAGTDTYVLTSAGPNATPTWTEPTTGTVTGSGLENRVARWTADGSDIGNGPITFSAATAAANSTFGGNVLIPTGKELIIGSQTTAESPLGITIRDNQGDTPVGIVIHNENTGSASDAQIAFETQGALDFSIGIDKSDSNKFVMSRASVLGTNNVFTIDGTTATFSGTVTATGNITTDGIFKVDSAPDNNILEVDQSGRKMALKTSFASNTTGSFWAFKVSTGNVNGAMTDALVLKPLLATFTGDITIDKGANGNAKINLLENSGGTQNAAIEFDQAGANALYISTNYESPTDDNRILLQPGSYPALTAYGGVNGSINTKVEISGTLQANRNIQTPNSDLSTGSNPTNFGIYNSEIRLIETPNGGLKQCRVITDNYGEWILVGRFAASAMTTIQSAWSSESGLDTSTSQSTTTKFSADFGDSYPTEVRIMGATDFTKWRDTRTVDFIYGVPEGRQWKFFFSGGVENGMALSTKYGWGINGAYDGFGRWVNPAQTFVRMADGNPTNPSAAYTTATTNAFNWNTAADAKFSVSATRVFSGQDNWVTVAVGVDDGGGGFFDAYPSEIFNFQTAGRVDFSSSVWVLIKLPNASSGGGGGGDTFWGESGTDIYNTNSGNVAIGATDPGNVKLFVQNPSASTDPVFETRLDTTYNMGISNRWVSTTVSKLKIGRSGTAAQELSSMDLIYDIAGAEYGSIKRNYSASSLKFERSTNTDMIIDGSGNVGISAVTAASTGFFFNAANKYLSINKWTASTATPAAMLHLFGADNDINVPAIIIEGRDNPNDTRLKIAVKDPQVRFLLDEGNDAVNGYGLMTFETTAQPNAAASERGGFDFDLPGGTAMTITNISNVGIGTASPDAKLNISKTSFSTTFTSADSYIRIGKAENAQDGYQFIGFGYNNGSTDLVPAYIGYQQTGTPGNYTKGDLVFGTRNVTTNTIPTERMRINATGNVLIGNPSVDHAYKLQIEGNDIMLNTENSIQGKSIYARYSSQFTIQCDSELRFSTGGSPTQKMVIQAGGNVGIGVTSPTGAKLEVKKDHGDTWVADFHNISADYQGVRIRQDSTSGSGGPGSNGNSALVVDDQRANNMVTPTPTVYIKRSGANTNGLLLSVEPHAVTGLTVNDLGRVGIGTEAPDAQLEVETASYAATNAVANFINGNNPTRVAYDTVVVAQTDVASLSLVETPAGGQSVEQKLTFAVGDTNAVIRTANTSGGMWFNVNASVSASAYLTTSGTNAIRILNSGNVGILDSTPSYELDVDGTIRATGDIIAYSDVRVKENIKTIDNSLEKVSKLRGVEFNKIGKDEKSIGVIAQEIEKVIPEVVREDEKGMKSVAYGNISGLLIEAIKELKAEIDELKKHSCDCKK